MSSGENVVPGNMPTTAKKKGLPTFVIVLIAIALTLSIAYWVFTAYLFPTEFSPVELSKKEQQQLDNKRDVLTGKKPKPSTAGDEPLQPEAYSEAGASSEIRFNEKELNALLANNTDLAN